MPSNNAGPFCLGVEFGYDCEMIRTGAVKSLGFTTLALLCALSCRQPRELKGTGAAQPAGGHQRMVMAVIETLAPGSATPSSSRAVTMIRTDFEPIRA